MDITFFLCTLHQGGAEHQLSILANLLAEMGYSISIVTFGDDADYFHLNPAIERVRLAPNKSKISKFLAIFNHFRKINSGVVISYCQRNNKFVSIPLLINRRIKWIAGERSFTPGCISKSEKVIFKLYNRACHIVPNSHSQANHIIHYAPNLRSKITVIPNYTDRQVFKPLSEKKVNLGPVRFCVFARYNPEKNYLRLAESLKVLKEKGYQFQLDWYGTRKLSDGSLKKDVEIFESKIREFSLDNMVSLKESVSNVAGVLVNYDCSVLPSVYEGFSNTIAEAICCGLPVLASNVSDNYLMVHDSVNGFLFDPLSIESIIDAFEKFLELSPIERSKMGEISLEIADSIFDKKKFLNDYVRLIAN